MYSSLPALKARFSYSSSDVVSNEHMGQRHVLERWLHRVKYYTIFVSPPKLARVGLVYTAMFTSSMEEQRL